MQRRLADHRLKCEPVTVATACDWMEGLNLLKSVNEVMLFHGCDAKIGDIIAKQGFESRASRSGLFGEGTYFGENSSKSDEYTGDATELTMILARVCLGLFHGRKEGYKGKMAPCVNNCQGACDHYRCDSLVCGTGGAVHRHREFVVFDNTLMFPQFLIKYKRV